MEQCPLCNLDKREGEKIWYVDDKIIIVDAKNKKGHKGRIMVVWKEHKKELSKEDEDYAISKLVEIGKQIFSYTKFFEIYSDKYSSIMNHWHRIAADINPDADDYLQVLNTPRYLYKSTGEFVKELNC